MCRHLAYLGPARTLHELVVAPAHGLLVQSYAPADMRGGGTINADGFGVGWYPADGPSPALSPASAPAAAPASTTNGTAGRAAPDAVRYRSATPMWSDPAFAALAGVTRSSAVLAAVRSATVGMPVTAAAAAPFAEGRWLFSHNGVVRGWPHALAGPASRLPVTDLLTLDAPTDAALLWALVRHRLRRGADPAAALTAVLTEVAAAAPGSRLNLLLTDGSAIWATTWGHALSMRVAGPASPAAADHGAGPLAVVASEPLDADPSWTEVPDRHLVVARPGHHRTTALGATAPDATAIPTGDR